jgi:Ca-activated chloride channel family protein
MKRHLLNLAVATVALFSVVPAITNAVPPISTQTPKPPSTAAVVFLVDVSGSMSQGQLNIAKEAAKASLKALRDSDRFGTLAFNTASTWIAPLQPAGNREAINTQIDAMYAGGGTNIYVGLNAAFEGLKDAKEDVKTVILLSDGLTQSADFQGLATNMHNAGISISSISVGLQANRTLMADLALWGKAEPITFKRTTGYRRF